MSELKVGDKAPDFAGLNQNNETIKLDQYKGKKLILYFYPKDNTPGCTAEACDLSNNYSNLIEKGFDVVGVSPDSISSHQKFIAKQNLKFNLISDSEKTILKSYFAWGFKKMYGKEYEGVLRKTFIIDENGYILSIINKVNTKDHTNQILKELNI